MSRLGGHWLGTDHLGRDILARVIYGTRVSLLVGTGAVVLGATVGILLGSIAGFGGGWRDSVIMRIVDVQLAIPMVLVAIGWAAFVRPSLMSVTIMIALWGWAKYARVSRGAVLVLREQEFVLAAAALGATRTRLIIRHVLPNLLPIVLVLATLEVGRAILLESTLSFLGLGLQPPTVSWGVMLDDAKDYLEVAWWGAVFPGLAISLFVLSANLLGDALRDALDPRLRRSGI
jgi:peptide/nickel transport system permease protein